MKPAYFIAAAFAGALLPSAAFAQDATPAEVTLGVTAGYHDLGISDEVYDLTGVEVDDGSPIFGGFASVDFPVSDSVFIGAEGNLSIGTDAIDSDYGASARLGYRTPNGTKVYVRGGYQWVELDYANMLNVDKSAIPAGLDDTVGDYLVGGGVNNRLLNQLAADATGRTAVHAGQGTTSVLSRPSATPVAPTPRRRSSEASGRAGAGRGGLLGARRVGIGILVGAVLMLTVASVDSLLGAEVPVLGSFASSGVPKVEEPPPLPPPSRSHSRRSSPSSRPMPIACPGRRAR